MFIKDKRRKKGRMVILLFYPYNVYMRCKKLSGGEARGRNGGDQSKSTRTEQGLWPITTRQRI